MLRVLIRPIGFRTPVTIRFDALPTGISLSIRTAFRGGRLGGMREVGCCHAVAWPSFHIKTTFPNVYNTVTTLASGCAFLIAAVQRSPVSSLSPNNPPSPKQTIQIDPSPLGFARTWTQRKIELIPNSVPYGLRCMVRNLLLVSVESGISCSHGLFSVWMVRSFSGMTGGSPIAGDISSHQSTHVANFANDEKLPQGI